MDVTEETPPAVIIEETPPAEEVVPATEEELAAEANVIEGIEKQLLELLTDNIAVNANAVENPQACDQAKLMIAHLVDNQIRVRDIYVFLGELARAGIRGDALKDKILEYRLEYDRLYKDYATQQALDDPATSVTDEEMLFFDDYDDAELRPAVIDTYRRAKYAVDITFCHGVIFHRYILSAIKTVDNFVTYLKKARSASDYVLLTCTGYSNYLYNIVADKRTESYIKFRSTLQILLKNPDLDACKRTLPRHHDDTCKADIEYGAFWLMARQVLLEGERDKNDKPMPLFNHPDPAQAAAMCQDRSFFATRIAICDPFYWTELLTILNTEKVDVLAANPEPGVLRDLMHSMLYTYARASDKDTALSKPALFTALSRQFVPENLELSDMRRSALSAQKTDDLLQIIIGQGIFVVMHLSWDQIATLKNKTKHDKNPALLWNRFMVNNRALAAARMNEIVERDLQDTCEKLIELDNEEKLAASLQENTAVAEHEHADPAC